MNSIFEFDITPPLHPDRLAAGETIRLLPVRRWPCRVCWSLVGGVLGFVVAAVLL